ncbi:hypothetical protein E4188_22350 (plasmid) [Aeromonas media]|uniref:Uncharacterized protein n=1 Tax=Aeromonas media TaxID=651 RepID=A0ABX6NZL9_AERME|nr:hypothetical protein [Aeromonas media]QJT36991.1 hypothetical protein E4187_22110 [Aeromonas media]QJT41243.1 hypothetical protein E4188_22350 [Aeromonas media]
MSKSKYSPTESRIQLKAPDDVVSRLLDAKLGTKLRKALSGSSGSMEISPALERIINDESKAKRVTILLQVLFGALDNMEAGLLPADQETPTEPKKTVVKPAAAPSSSGKPKPDMKDFNT